jgi:hypothetical protein
MVMSVNLGHVGGLTSQLYSEVRPTIVSHATHERRGAALAANIGKLPKFSVRKIESFLCVVVVGLGGRISHERKIRLHTGADFGGDTCFAPAGEPRLLMIVPETRDSSSVKDFEATLLLSLRKSQR